MQSPLLNYPDCLYVAHFMWAPKRTCIIYINDKCKKTKFIKTVTGDLVAHI